MYIYIYTDIYGIPAFTDTAIPILARFGKKRYVLKKPDDPVESIARVEMNVPHWDLGRLGTSIVAKHCNGHPRYPSQLRRSFWWKIYINYIYMYVSWVVIGMPGEVFRLSHIRKAGFLSVGFRDSIPAGCLETAWYMMIYTVKKGYSATLNDQVLPRTSQYMSICSIILPTMFDIIPETIQIRRAGNFKVVYGVLPSATVAGALEACSASDALHQRFQGSKTHDVETWRDIGWLQYVAI